MEKLLKTKKITRASLKSFIKRNENNLYVNHKRTFDGMVDGCVSLDDGWKPSIKTERSVNHTLGIDGLWIVARSAGSGADYFTLFNQDGYIGIEISNCCGYSIIAVKQEV